jgi:hypothetical protein
MSPVPPPDRLALSRERLRQAMQGPAAAASAQPGSPANKPAPGWLADLKSIPAVAIVIDALTRWWARHPLHVAAVVAADTATAVARPMAQRHPWRLVLGAALVGGVIVWSRPWRWGLRPALFAGLLPQLLRTALEQ